MKIGLIGCGTVGSTLHKYLLENTAHEVYVSDPAKGFNHDLEIKKPYAIFISIPVHPGPHGQDQTALEQVAAYAKKITPHVFIRSTVLPGTNDRLGTYSMPEYLTARRAYEDFVKLPLVFGSAPRSLISQIFSKKIATDGHFVQVSNTEAELAKYVHNLFGLTKVHFFNEIYKYCQNVKADFESVKQAANVTGYLGTEHMQVPGHDGKMGFGGYCFGPNLESWINHLERISDKENVQHFVNRSFFKEIREKNLANRGTHE